MNDQPSTSQQWEACPPGELRQLATRLHWRRRDRALAKAVGVTGAMVVLLFGGVLAVQQFRGLHDGPHGYGDISCAEVQAHIRDYVAGQLEPQLSQRIQVHLKQCPECGPPFRRMMAEIKQEVSYSPVMRSEIACTCSHCEQPMPATGTHILTNGPDAVSVAMHVPR